MGETRHYFKPLAKYERTVQVTSPYFLEQIPGCPTPVFHAGGTVLLTDSMKSKCAAPSAKAKESEATKGDHENLCIVIDNN